METSTFDPIEIDFNNQDAWDLICDGKTKGVFQLESSLGRAWSKRVKPRNIEDLAALVSIIRPGCLKAIVDGKSMTQHYVDRKNGSEEIVYIHDSLEPILKNTQGVLVYQEQSMEIAQKIAGFNLQQADDLRKAIGKKKADLMAKIKKRFVQGATDAAIVSKEAAEEIFSWIEKSSRYAFNKSHAVSYAICGYWSAYAKSHHPLEFYCNYLYYAHGKPDPQEEIRELVRDAKSIGVSIHPPSLKSLNETTSIIDKKIHFGLSDLKTIGKKQIDKLKDILPEAENLIGKKVHEMSWYETLVSIGDLLYSPLAIAMISTGMFSHTKLSRLKMLDDFDTWQKLTAKEIVWVKENYKDYDNILDLLKAASPVKKEGGAVHNSKRTQVILDLVLHLENPPSSLEDDPRWVIGTEENYLGVAVTYSKIESSDISMSDTTCRDCLDGKKGKMKIAVTLNAIRKWTTKGGKNPGQEMAFLSVEDNTGELDNMAIFSESWKEYKNILYEGNNVLLFCNASKNRDGFVVDKVIEI